METYREWNMFVVRRLHGLDMQAVNEILGARRTIMGLPSDQVYESETRERVNQYLQDHQNRILFGAFKGNLLVNFLAMRFWDELPYWTLHLWKTNPRASSIFNVNINGHRDLLCHCLKYAEARGYFKYYACYSAKMHRQLRLRTLSEIPYLAERYVFTREAVVKAGEIPSHPILANIVGARSWQEDIIIFSRSLKDEFRFL